MKNVKVQGLFLVDVDSAALNNAGKDTRSVNENAIATKSIWKDRNRYVYAAGQALGSWWRRTLMTDFGWNLSPLLADEKITFTSGNPFEFPDDDLFGYMKASKDKVVDTQTGEVMLDGKGKEKLENATVTRIAPLKKSAMVSVVPVIPVRHFSVMSRQDGNPVPYVKEEYSCVMKSQFSIDTFWVGRFSSYNKSGFKNITLVQRNEFLAKGCSEIDDPYMLDGKGNPHRLVSMAQEARHKRIQDTIMALTVLNGGAMQTNNMADVTPKFIILALTTSGNHPFGTITGNGIDESMISSASPAGQEEDNKNDTTPAERGPNDRKFTLNIDALMETLRDYKKQFIGPVYIGKRTGFGDQYTDVLKGLENLGENYPTVKFGSVVEATEAFCAGIIKYID